MLRNGRSEYLGLAEYLNVARRSSARGPNSSLIVALVVTFIGLVSFDAIEASPGASALFLLTVAVCWFMVFLRRPKPPSAEELAKADVAETATRMNACLDRSRLHRDLGQPVMTLLEDCARHWAEIRHAMGTPYWQSDDVPPHYRALRNQVLIAADRTMDETILLFRDVLPDDPSKSDVKGFVGEFIQEAVFGGARPRAHLHPGFGKARVTADKLRDLAAEVSSMTRQASEELGPRIEVNASSALDHCIGELKSIQQAESELRQSLRG